MHFWSGEGLYECISRAVSAVYWFLVGESMMKLEILLVTSIWSVARHKWYLDSSVLIVTVV